MIIYREGTFKAKNINHGVSTTKNGYPQFVAKFSAIEIWDEEEGVWVDWSEYDQQITGYSVLFGGKGETLTCQQLKKALGWDGQSFTTLDSGDYSDVIVQIRVEEQTYEDKTSLQIAWIDEETAAPGTSVKKLDKAGLSALDAQYAKLLKAGGKKAAPATAPKKTTKPTIPGTGKNVTKKSNVPDTPVEDDDKDVTGSPPEDEVESTSKTEIKPMTKDEAWEAILEIVPGANDDEKVVVDISREWTHAVKEIGQGKKTKDMTKEQFGQVYERVVTKLIKF